MTGFVVPLGCTLAMLTFNPAAVAQNTGVRWHSFDMGYSLPAASNTAVKSVVGQILVGRVAAPGLEIMSGFLADTSLRSTILAVREQNALPRSYMLAQNFPNPFNPGTTIHFELPREARVTLKVYNLIGQEVLTLLDEKRIAGRYDVHLDGSGLASGVYLYRLMGNEFVSAKKFVLLK